MDKLLAGTTSSYGATYTLDYVPTAPLTFNDPALAASSRSALEGALGKDQVLSPAPTMVAEDFAFYQQKIPGFYFFLGTGNPERGITSNWHTETFDIDEAALAVGVCAMSAVLVQALWKEHARDRAGRIPRALGAEYPALAVQRADASSA